MKKNFTTNFNIMQLRPLTMQDADFMLELKNDPQTRKFAILSHEEIKKEDHYKWLEQNIQFFHVIESDNKLFGVIRIQDNEVSIWVDKKMRSKGIAVDVLRKTTNLGMTAKIVEGNIASMRAFINSGFKPIAYIDTEKYYIFQK